MYWLEEMLKALPYGEVGIVYVMHEGKITNTRYVLESRCKANRETGPPRLPILKRT